MSTSDTATDSDLDGRVVDEYVLGVRIVDDETDEPGERYRFEAPEHTDIAFDTLEDARLYADVYFDVNGFVEEGTGERGVPPEVVQSGKDTLAAYLITCPWADVNWVASFYGTTPTEIERYCSWVRDRADEIRSEAKRRGHD
ncbi:hypothetical protein [Natrinema salifodinae]|uniref:Uncharacterized protein n=1 Tax=Natrinema salifodinae TaxID=1202768 RepID=A0A1I0NMG7_9EURY|nr:hypothetical protein [Natrinema salifodinae]SEW02584.1 hypothetical protein SAMN05216285_1905 [Natrinema salifodinae]